MDNVGLGIDIGAGDEGTETRLYGQRIDNLKEELKREIIKEIQEEIIKPENEKIRAELEELKEAIFKKDGGLMKRAIEKIMEKGAEKGINILINLFLISSLSLAIIFNEYLFVSLTIPKTMSVFHSLSI